MRRFLLSVMAAVLCLGTLATALTALELTTAAVPAGASTAPVHNSLECHLTITGTENRTTATTFDITVASTVTPKTVHVGTTFQITFVDKTTIAVPKSETGATVKSFGTIEFRLYTPAGTTLKSVTIITHGYTFPPGDKTIPADHKAISTSVTIVSDANSPSGKAILLKVATKFTSVPVTVSLPTLAIKLKATAPTSDSLGYGFITAQPTGGASTSADPAIAFEVTVTESIASEKVASNCWPSPHPQPALAAAHVIDTTPPAITIAAPGATSKVVKGSKVHSAFGCVDPPVYGDGLQYCRGTATGHPITSGTLVTTTVLGSHYLKVTSENNSTVKSSKTAHYTVILPPYNLVPPTVTINSPVNNAQYIAGSTVKASFSCASSTTTIASCTGTVASGSPISTTVGYHTFTVTATDRRGNTATKSIGYYVRVSNTPTATTSGDKIVTATVSAGSNDSCGLGHNYYSTFLDGLSTTLHTCPTGNHSPETTWKVTAPGANGGQLVVGDHITVQEQIYKPGYHAASGTGGYDSGPYKETLSVTAPTGTKLVGKVTTSKTGLPSATYGGTASATTAAACNYTNSASLTEGTSACNTTTGNIASTTVAAAGSTTVGTYGSTTVGTYGSTTVGTYGSTTIGAYGSTTVGAYGSTTVNTLFSTKIKSTTNGKKIKTITTMHITSDSGSPSSGHLEVVTNKGIEVMAYTGHASTTFTGVSVFTGSTGTATVSTGAVVQQPLAVSHLTVLPISSVTGFQTTAGGTVTVATTSGTAVFKYTSDSTSNTTCGTNPCFTTLTLLSGSGKIAKGNAVTQVEHTIGTNVTLHAAADSGFTSTGTLHVATSLGTAVVSYTSDSTTAATCGSAACFKGITWKSGAKGIPTVSTGAITQVVPNEKTFTGAATPVLHAAADSGFTSAGTLLVRTSLGTTAVMSYTADSTSTATCGSAACFTGVTWKSGGTKIVTVPTPNPTYNKTVGGHTTTTATKPNPTFGKTVGGHTTTTATKPNPTFGKTVGGYVTSTPTSPTFGNTVGGHTTTTATIPNPTFGNTVGGHTTTTATIPNPTFGKTVGGHTTTTATKPNPTFGNTVGGHTTTTATKPNPTFGKTVGGHITTKKTITVPTLEYGNVTAGGAITQLVPEAKTFTGAATPVLHAAADTGFTSSGRLTVATSKGNVVLSYTGDSTTAATCGSAACFTGVTYVSGGTSGTGTVTAAGAITQLVPEAKTFTGAATPVLHAAADTGFSSSGRLTVATSKGTVVLSYTGDSTTAATCGSAACFTGVTYLSGGTSGTGTVSASGAIKQTVPTVTSFTGSGVLHAAADTGFKGSGTLRVATSAGTATVTYTSDSTTAATCGSAACFKGVTWVSGGAGGLVNTSGTITQTLSTVSSFTGSGTFGVASTSGFTTPGLVSVATSNGTAWLRFTGTSGSNLTGVTDESGTVGTLTPGGAVTQGGPGGNNYQYVTTTTSNVAVTALATALATVTRQSTVTHQATPGGTLVLAAVTYLSPSGTVQVVTTTGVATLSYTSISGTTLKGVNKVSGAGGHIYSGAYVAQPTQSPIKGAVKVAGTSVSGYTWAVTVTGKSTFAIQWDGSSCQTTAGTPKPSGDNPCGTNADELYGMDGTYIYVKYTLVVTATGTITLPGISGVAADQHDYQQGTGVFTTAKKWGTTTFNSKAITKPAISWTAVDPNPPVATLSTPSQGAVYSYGQTVKATYTCSDPSGGVTISSCTGVETTTPVANGATLTTHALVTNEIHRFKVTATNSEGYTSTSYSSFTVLASPPVLATQAPFTVTSGGSVTVPFNYSGTYPATHSTEKIVSTPSHGTATIQPTGKITYHNNNTANSTDSFKFSVSDTADNPSNVEIVTLHVQNQNKPTITAVTPPASGSGSYARKAVTVATYSCGDTVEVISCTATQTVTGTNTPVTSGQPFDTTSLIVGNTHHLLITAVGFGGVLGNQTTTETVSYTVNTPHPVARNFTVKMPATAGHLTVNALAHVTSTFPITPGTIRVVTGASHGTATVEISHEIKYTPKATTLTNEVTHDSFTYNVKDTDSQVSNTATVGVAIYPVPTITHMDRTGGLVSGGAQVFILGTGFSTVESVKFGTVTASAFTVTSPTQITATSPVHAAGTVRVSVTTFGGTTPTTSADRYKYSVPPAAVTSVSPSNGKVAGGTTVTVSGSGFTGATTVLFGTVKGTTVSVNAKGTQLTVKSPPGTAGSSVNVRVKTPTGESPVVTADLFSYGPSITSVAPTSGAAAGGSQVTITGTQFSTVQHVEFGATAAPSFTVRSATQIVATSPAHAAGTVTISVVTAGGTTGATPADVYKYLVPAPVVVAISPSSGSALGGTSVTVSGSALAGATTVLFGANKGTTVSINAGGTQLTVKSPAGTSGTSVGVRVVTSAGESANVSADLFTYGPTISSVSPVSGPTTGGTQVTITGTGFSTVQHVKFGATTATGVTVKSATQIVATSPAHAAGTVTISVVTAGGTTPATGADLFDFTVAGPVVTAISPASGTAAGGTSVTVSGSALGGAETVLFGASKGTTVSVNAGGTQLTVKSPAGTSGTSVAVTVKTPGGTSALVPADLFTYGPTVASVSPTSGPVTGGTQVTITGTGFSTVHGVKFGTTTAQSYTVRSVTQIVASSPVHASGTVGITVVTAGGTTLTTNADHFKFTVSVPAVSAISPASGAASGGTTVTVSGSGFGGATTVLFGANKGTTVSVNAGGTQLTVKSPAGTAGSSVAVTVKTPGGTSALVPADLFTYGPTITSLSRTTGSVAGGTKVTITGTGFVTVQHVKFGTTTATTYTVSSPTSIIATAPAHAAGTVGISVVTAAGTTPTTVNDQYKYH